MGGKFNVAAPVKKHKPCFRGLLAVGSCSAAFPPGMPGNCEWSRRLPPRPNLRESFPAALLQIAQNKNKPPAKKPPQNTPNRPAEEMKNPAETRALPLLLQNPQAIRPGLA